MRVGCSIINFHAIRIAKFSHFSLLLHLKEKEIWKSKHPSAFVVLLFFPFQREVGSRLNTCQFYPPSKISQHSLKKMLGVHRREGVRVPSSGEMDCPQHLHSFTAAKIIPKKKKGFRAFVCRADPEINQLSCQTQPM